MWYIYICKSHRPSRILVGSRLLVLEKDGDDEKKWVFINDITNDHRVSPQTFILLRYFVKHSKANINIFYKIV